MNNIRSGQLLSPFGIGQIVNFPGENSLMVCGLNLWDERLRLKEVQDGTDTVDESLLKITEPRLQKKLGVQFFRKPFPYLTDGKKNVELEIPAVRFPGWFVCTNPKCGTMRPEGLNSRGTGGVLNCNNNGCNSTMVPVRFVAACPEGHIQDVPFMEWVHNGPVPNNDDNHILKYTAASGSGDLGSIFISCTCKASKTLAGLMNVRKDGNVVFDSALARIGLGDENESKFDVNNRNDDNPLGQYCKGYQPWLGSDGISNAVPCGNHLQVLIRGASNIHYANIESAIFLPEITEESNPIVEEVLQEKNTSIAQLKKMFDMDGTGDLLSEFILSDTSIIRDKRMLVSGLKEVVVAEIQRNSNVSDERIEPYNIKWEEYQYILKGRNSENADFKAIKKAFDRYLEKKLLEDFFESVVLVEKLKETRVFTGFSRINSDNGNREAKMQQLSNSPITWLPAYEVYGEGVFLKFRDDKLDEWLASFESIPDKLTERYHYAMFNRGGDNFNRYVNRAFTMIHTFAHLLIKRMCFNCGYGSSSLRERIYFSSDPETRMNGIMIYTSSGDSEGSMGGLVRQGKEQFLGKLVREALEDARWCSADPVCSDIGKSAGQGPDNVNGAACHNCAIVPETSCEEFNSLLDRSLVVGESSFFGEEF